jgi:E3 ubiquitin-protein ligase RNF14
MAQIDVGDVTAIKCPNPACERQLLHHEIQQLVSAEQFARFERFVVLSCLRVDSTIRRCPNGYCDFVFYLDPDPNSDKSEHEMRAHPIICPRCAIGICQLCGERNHPTVSCSQHRAGQEPVDWRTRRRLRDMGAQVCPNCGMGAVRIAGCPSMRCPKCHHYWKWQNSPEETKLEKIAFWYPRLWRGFVGSNEIHQGQMSAGEVALIAGMFSLIGLGALPVTLTLALPAGCLKAARSSKTAIRNARADWREYKKERRQQRDQRLAQRLASPSAATSHPVAASSSTPATSAATLEVIHTDDSEDEDDAEHDLQL